MTLLQEVHTLSLSLILIDFWVVVIIIIVLNLSNSLYFSICFAVFVWLEIFVPLDFVNKIQCMIDSEQFSIVFLWNVRSVLNFIFSVSCVCSKLCTFGCPFGWFQLILTLNDQFKRDFFVTYVKQLYRFAAYSPSSRSTFWLILIFECIESLCLINLSAHLEVVYFDTRNIFLRVKWLTTIERTQQRQRQRR